MQLVPYKSLKIDDTNSDAYANRAICFSYIDENKKSKKDVKEAVKRANEEGLKQAIRLVEEKKAKELKLLTIKKSLRKIINQKFI